VVRTLDPVAHGTRRDAILDTAERLIRSDGYERMSIQDVQDALGVSRGAIYHYFPSKAALLEAVVERTGDAVLALLRPIVDDPGLTAVAKLQTVFEAGGRWKSERRDLMLALLQGWYSDENAVVREHLIRATGARLGPLMADIVRQGVSEGSMRVASPEHAPEIIVALFTASGDQTGRLLLEREAGRVPFEHAASLVAAYSEAVERILGLALGSFALMDEPTLRFWFG
jgi:AcrR family transcriptional regulator